MILITACLLIIFISVSYALKKTSININKQRGLPYKPTSKVDLRHTANVSPFSKKSLDSSQTPSKLTPSSYRLPQRIFSDMSERELIGEDAATFSLAQQSFQEWGTFLVAVGGIISFLFYVWIYSGGPLLGDKFKEVMEGLAGGDSTLTITYMLLFFAVSHSGLATVRPAAEKIVGKSY